MSLTSQSAMRPTMFRLINTTTEHTRREEERPRKNRHMTNTPARAPSSVFMVRLSIVMNLSIHRKFWLKARAKPEPEGSAASLVAYISTTALSVSMVEKRNSICNFEVVMTPDSSRMMLVITLGLTSGVLKTELSNNYENWYPQKSQAWEDYTLQKERFGRYNRTNMFLLEETLGTYGVLEKSVLETALALHNDIADRDDFRSLCEKDATGDECKPSLSILSLWSYNSTVLSMQSQGDILSTVNAGASTVLLDAVIGGMTRDGSNAITGAKALQVIMSIQDVVAREEEILKFENDVFLAKCDASSAANANSHSTYCNSFRSYSDESDR